MEKPTLPFTQALEKEIEKWEKFRRALRKDDQQFLDRLFEKAKAHIQAEVDASRPWPFEAILISILIEHEKAMAELRLKLKTHEERIREGDI